MMKLYCSFNEIYVALIWDTKDTFLEDIFARRTGQYDML